MDEDTQEIADAKESVSLVLAAAMSLAFKVVDHVERHEVASATMKESLDSAGFVWELAAGYDGGLWVRTWGTPVPSQHGGMVTVETMGQIMVNHESRFDFSFPRQWLDHARAGSEAL